MVSGTGTLNLGSQKCVRLPSEIPPVWTVPLTLPESTSSECDITLANYGPDLKERGSTSGLKEHDYIGLAEHSAFENTPSTDVMKENDPSFNVSDLHLELGLGIGTASTRRTGHERFADLLFRQTDSTVGGPKEEILKAVIECGFAEVAILQRPRQNSLHLTSDVPKSSTQVVWDKQMPKKVATYTQDFEECPTKANLSGFYGANLKNGIKRGYTEAMHDAARFDSAGGTGKVAEGEAKSAPRHQGENLANWVSSKSTVSGHRLAGPESLPISNSLPRNEKSSTDNVSRGSTISNVCKERATTEPPPPKGQVVGWPPIPSYRKQNLAKPVEIFVKVNMDGMTVGRKVDLNAHSSYEGLYLTLEEMFQPSNNGGQGIPSIQGKECHLSDAKQARLFSGLDYVLTYEDQDGDWMMVGDVPWSMFVNMVRRLRIARTSDATGLAANGRPDIMK